MVPWMLAVNWTSVFVRLAWQLLWIIYEPEQFRIWFCNKLKSVNGSLKVIMLPEIKVCCGVKFSKTVGFILEFKLGIKFKTGL